MADLDVFKEDFALLFEAGMVAIKQGDEASAKALFQALQVLDPEHTAHELGSGLLHLHKWSSQKQKFYSVLLLKKIPRIGVLRHFYHSHL